MQTILIVIHVLLAISLIGMILVQRGPGAAAGAAFGSGASSTVFGSRGAGSFLTRTTAFLGAAFFLVSLTMAVMLSRGMFASEEPADMGVLSGLVEPAEEQQPANQTEPAKTAPTAAPQDAENTPVPTPPQDAAAEDAADQPSAVPKPPPGGGADGDS